VFGYKNTHNNAENFLAYRVVSVNYVESTWQIKIYCYSNRKTYVLREKPESSIIDSNISNATPNNPNTYPNNEAHTSKIVIIVFIAIISVAIMGFVLFMSFL
jgi:hypothetical protein